MRRSLSRSHTRMGNGGSPLLPLNRVHMTACCCKYGAIDKEVHKVLDLEVEDSGQDVMPVL